MFDNVRSDFRAHNRDFGAQGFWAMLVYRFGRWRYGLRWVILRKFCSFIYKLLFKFVQIITGIELPCEAEMEAISSSTILAASLSAVTPSSAIIAASEME